MRAGIRSAARLAAFLLLAPSMLPGARPEAGEAREATPVIRAVFQPSRVEEGGLVQVEVRARGLRKAGAVSFHLVYDPTRLAPVETGTSEGGIFRRDGARTRFLSRQASTGDRIIVGLSRLGRGRGARGDGLVARFVFRALASGATSVVFDQAELSDPAAREIPARFLPGDLLVQTRKEQSRGR